MSRFRSLSICEFCRDVKFVVTGDDLADVFYLTGLALPNTPKYRLAATVHVVGTQFKVDDLKGRLGSSDIAGQGEVETAGARPKLTAKLSSNYTQYCRTPSPLSVSRRRKQVRCRHRMSLEKHLRVNRTQPPPGAACRLGHGCATAKRRTIASRRGPTSESCAGHGCGCHVRGCRRHSAKGADEGG